MVTKKVLWRVIAMLVIGIPFLAFVIIAFDVPAWFLFVVMLFMHSRKESAAGAGIWTLLVIILVSQGYISVMSVILAHAAWLFLFVIWFFVSETGFDDVLTLFLPLLHGRYRKYGGRIMAFYSAESMSPSMMFTGNRFNDSYKRISTYDDLYNEYIMRSVNAAFAGHEMDMMLYKRQHGLFVASSKIWGFSIPVVVLLMKVSRDEDVKVHATVRVLWLMFRKAAHIKADLEERLAASRTGLSHYVDVRVTALF